MSVNRHTFSAIEELLAGAKAVFLDLDNTLYRYEPCHAHAIEAARRFINGALRTKINQADFLKEYSDARAEVKKRVDGSAASHSRLLYFQQMIERRTGKTRARIVLRAEKTYWSHFFKKMKLLPEVIPFLRLCKKRGICVCLVTDLTAEIQFKKVMALAINSYVDYIISSEEAGADKPHEKIFSLALKKAGVEPHEVVFVGDDHEKDFLGASAMGIRAILI